MSKPIKIQKVVIVYTCPHCSYENEYENPVSWHIYEKHTYLSLEKEVKLSGRCCEFTSEEQAKTFTDAYARYRSRRDFDETYKAEVKWEGPGKYHFDSTMTRDFHHQSDLGECYR